MDFENEERVVLTVDVPFHSLKKGTKGVVTRVAGRWGFKPAGSKTIYWHWVDRFDQKHLFVEHLAPCGDDDDNEDEDVLAEALQHLETVLTMPSTENLNDALAFLRQFEDE